MNHVVEGITATYSLYYTPAPVNIYFLRDLRDLARMLPRIRPTVFFSVPRFYEKLWARMQNNRLGKLYLGLSENVVKRMLRPLLRRSLLRKAGFDRCAQLLVGSAPSSPGLLRAYHELGIEVCDTYGLTEAPLITLNRHAANRIGTVGELLPETQVRIAADGEILVRGPQVTAGYFNENEATPFRDGWLATGDLALPVNAKMAYTTLLGIPDRTGGNWAINRYSLYRTSHAAISFRARPPESRPMPTHQRRAQLSPSPTGTKYAHGHSRDYGRRTARSSRYLSITPSGLMLSTR